MRPFHLRLVLTGTICSVCLRNLPAGAQYRSSVFTLVTQPGRTHNLVASLLKVKHFWETTLSRGGAQICITFYFKIDCSGIWFYQVKKLISPLATAFPVEKKKSLNSLKVPDRCWEDLTWSFLPWRQCCVNVYLHTLIRFAHIMLFWLLWTFSPGSMGKRWLFQGASLTLHTSAEQHEHREEAGTERRCITTHHCGHGEAWRVLPLTQVVCGAT